MFNMRLSHLFQPYALHEQRYPHEARPHVGWQGIQFFVHGAVKRFHDPTHDEIIIAYMLYFQQN
jgi:hypothetical protein